MCILTESRVITQSQSEAFRMHPLLERQYLIRPRKGDGGKGVVIGSFVEECTDNSITSKHNAGKYD